MPLKKKSIAVIAIAGFTTATLAQAKALKSHLMTPYEEQEEGDYDIIVINCLLLKIYV